MAKIIPITNHIKFKSKQNARKQNRPKLRLRGYNTENDGKHNRCYLSAIGRKHRGKFSVIEKEMMLHIRDLFTDNGERAEYFNWSNSIILTMENDLYIYPFIMSFKNDVLTIYSIIGHDTGDDDSIYERMLEYIGSLNFNIPMGSFDFCSELEMFLFKLGIPLYEKPSKEFIEKIFNYIRDTLNKYIHRINSRLEELSRIKKEN